MTTAALALPLSRCGNTQLSCAAVISFIGAHAELAFEAEVPGRLLFRERVRGPHESPQQHCSRGQVAAESPHAIAHHSEETSGIMLMHSVAGFTTGEDRAACAAPPHICDSWRDCTACAAPPHICGSCTTVRTAVAALHIVQSP